MFEVFCRTENVRYRIHRRRAKETMPKWWYNTAYVRVTRDITTHPSSYLHVTTSCRPKADRNITFQLVGFVVAANLLLIFFPFNVVDGSVAKVYISNLIYVRTSHRGLSLTASTSFSTVGKCDDWNFFSWFTSRRRWHVSSVRLVGQSLRIRAKRG